MGPGAGHIHVLPKVTLRSDWPPPAQGGGLRFAAEDCLSQTWDTGLTEFTYKSALPALLQSGYSGLLGLRESGRESEGPKAQE